MKENPISTRTKDSIERALIELMYETPYKSISVQALTARAGLSRQAFYSHFQDKDDVLVRHLATLLEGYLASIRAEQVDTVEKLVRFYTEAVESRAEFFKLLVDNELEGLAKRVFSYYLVPLPPVLACQRENNSDTERRYFNVFWVAAFIEVYAVWLSEGMATDREQIISIICDIMQGKYFPPTGGV